jgi:hypothetical protein
MRNDPSTSASGLVARGLALVALGFVVGVVVTLMLNRA